jgi:phage shock protein PspC (stress-responsive transcriptional regulator)
VLVLALDYAAKTTIALAVVFFVVFPALAHGLIVYAAAQVASEREQNRRYREGLDDEQ